MSDQDKIEQLKRNRDLGNTLDYYNEDLSRKAVGKLFSGDEQDVQGGQAYENGESLVRGFEGKNSENFEEKNSENFEETGRRKRVRPITANFDDPDLGYDFSIYRKKEQQERQERQRSATNYAQNDDPYQRDFSNEQGSGQFQNTRPTPQREHQNTYQQKPRPDKKPTGWQEYNDDLQEEEIGTARFQTGRQQAVKQQAQRDTSDLSDTQPRRKATKIENPVRVPYQNVVSKQQAPQPAQRLSKKRVAQTQALQDDPRDDAFDDVFQISPKVIIVGVSVFVAVILFAVLVFQVVSVNGKLKEANATIKKNQTVVNERDTLKADLETANSTITTMQAQIEAFNADLLRNPEDSETLPGETLTTDAQGAQTSTTTSSTSSKEHTVQSGETLGKISEQYYGNSTAGVKKIKDANGITDEKKVRIGQKLKIPS